MVHKLIKVNWSNLKSIKNAEKQKTKLENVGYNLVKTKKVGFDKFVLIYKKVD